MRTGCGFQGIESNVQLDANIERDCETFDFPSCITYKVLQSFDFAIWACNSKATLPPKLLRSNDHILRCHATDGVRLSMRFSPQYTRWTCLSLG